MDKKTDMDRVGLFSEPGYVSLGDKYRFAGSVGFNESAGKGKQMSTTITKSRNATQAGYFNDKFSRVMEGEGYSDAIRLKRKYRKDELRKNITSKPFLPSDKDKNMNGLGSYYGLIGGKLPHFEGIARSQSKKGGSTKRNFYTNPPQHGTGYGYLGVTFGKYPKNESEPYEKQRALEREENEAHKRRMKGASFKLNMHPEAYFEENPYKGESFVPTRKDGSKSHSGPPFRPSNPGKKGAGCKAGTFDPYPRHSEDTYKQPKGLAVTNVTNKFGKTFFPNAFPKSKRQPSVVNYNISRSVNAQNYRNFTSSKTVSAY